ncbi:hypothetical protein P691DRAFT_672356 [Macrolepiota fuliginosa MF-IS2]|uniref:TECPR1-like DysF domain-containing protein n=1 Tax=Macrolepiota fuliginosa MF-IS2 TaxID=1400762 RepID=A0A9P6C0V9_9AGAR|nr:hypothetical protein P691DRAFT_672356 [Macrolepiota fuliginosa MF-IS2]
MATLEYIDIPSSATRLEDSQKIQPAQKIITTLPQLDPQDVVGRHQRSNSSPSSSGLQTTPMAFIPQLLMGSIPTPSTAGKAAVSPPTNTRKKIGSEKAVLLSSRDPLSLPIMTQNFKRFVAKVGPVFWFQDRVEEILFWKGGWKRTATWMTLYVFLCYFPRTILLIPHTILIGIILSTYPWASSASPSTPSSPSDTSSTPTQQPAEGTAAWQANLQGIQNLMGFVAEMTTLTQPYTYHLSLTPLHLTPSTSNISSHASPTTRSPYTPQILTLLVVTFFPLLVLIHLPTFPIREVALFVGLAPFIATHPTVRALAPTLLHSAQISIPAILSRYERFITLIHPSLTKWIHMPIRTTIERFIDNDRLPDEIWRAEIREVELFENERYDGIPPVIESTGQGWSKANLRQGERSAWTRGRDGWTGIGPEDEIRSVPLQFLCSSNLTFSLSQNWRFVPTEDWRKDLTGDWAGCGGADEDAWVYTNDAWLGPRPGVYSAGGGSVTRRRRWVRRVWFDASAARDSQPIGSC